MILLRQFLICFWKEDHSGFRFDSVLVLVQSDSSYINLQLMQKWKWLFFVRYTGSLLQREKKTITIYNI